MLNSHLGTITLTAAIGSGLIAGVFFAFSTFVMNALARLESPQGIAAMQSISITVINPWFMTVFMGTAVACLFLIVFALLKWHQPSAVYSLVGSLLYLIGTFGVTMVCNVPLNDALAIIKPDSAEGSSFWAKYLTNWTLWNHVRTLAALAATVLLTIASNVTCDG
jgi:uncharacterized membrane protein